MSARGLLSISVLLAAGGQVLMKLGTNRTGVLGLQEGFGKLLARILLTPSIVAGLLLYGVSAVLWIVVLSRVELSLAYPMIAGGYVVVVLLSHWVLGEQLTLWKVMAVAFIVAGVVLLGRSG